MEIDFKSERKEKFYKDVSDIANYYNQTRQTQRLNLIISVLYNLLILFFVIGTIMAVIKSGTFGSIFGDQRDLQRRFDCVSGDIKDTVKSYDEAHTFMQMFGGTCTLYRKSNGG